MADRSRSRLKSDRVPLVPGSAPAPDPAPGSPGLDLTSPRALFAELLADALTTLGTRPSPLAISYLLGLLEAQVHSSAAPGEGIAPSLAEALLGAPAEGGRPQISRLRELGDRALFVSGFFGESLRRRVVDLDYYGEVGRTAYGRVSAELGRGAQARGWHELFEELADEFEAFVDVLAEVGSATRPPGSVNLLSAYDSYVETGSERERAKLIRAGVIPLPPESLRGRQ
jgi:hypothetical protein